ncbi:MAG: extracellular solute-binding protein [bacterium]|nr:extracellular solute-binding protein [bacterium]
MSDAVPEDAGTVEFWYFSHPIIAPALGPSDGQAAFNRLLPPGHILEAHFIGEWQYAVQKLTVSIAANDLPDLALVKRPWLARLAESGRLMPLDALLPTPLLEDISPRAREAGSIEGRLFGLPVDGFCLVLFYNRDMIGDVPPATWGELRTRAERISETRKTDGPGYALGHFPYLPALWSAGGAVVDGTTCGLAEPTALETLEYILALRDDGLMHPHTFLDPVTGLSLFLRGDVAMTVASSADVAKMKGATFAWEIAPIPGKEGPVSMLADDVLVAFGEYAEAKQKAIAAAIDQLIGSHILGEAAARRGSVPIRKSVLEEVTTPQPLLAAYDHARCTPLVGPWNEIEGQLMRHLVLAYRYVPPAESPDTP